jgi:PilZ domain-containing protein
VTWTVAWAASLQSLDNFADFFLLRNSETRAREEGCSEFRNRVKKRLRNRSRIDLVWILDE